MDEPRFVYQKSEDFPGYVAVMAQFMPTFEEQQIKAKKSIFGMFNKKPSNDND